MTFVFTDIAGSTRMFRELGEAYPPVLARHNELLRAAVSHHGGAEIKTEGDALFCAFADPMSAVLACIDGQRALAAEPWPDGVSVKVRIGMHTGDAVPVGGDYIALAVHQAARIAAVAHGGQVIASDATLRALGSLPDSVSSKDLGPNLLKDFPDPVRIWQVSSGDMPTDFPPLRTRLASLPAPRTTFIGRGAELTEVGAAVAEPGLTTIVGPGGVGKTRLVIEVATAVAATGDVGVHFAELSRETDEEAIASTFARQMSAAETSGDSVLDSLCGEIGSRRVLLVIDNCEQVVDDVASVVDVLIRRCANLTVLATSRIPLEIDGERRISLHPLAVEAEDARTGDAVRLFLDRVASASGVSEFSPEDIEAATEVCRRLDGLPLALELAASTVATVPLPVLVTELDSRLDLLKSRGRSPRQRTLRALLDWSHELLSDQARRGLRRLALFPGPFGIAAAAAVIGGVDDIAPQAAARIMAELAAHSFVSVDVSGGSYSLLETVRVYAADHLDACGEREAVEAALIAHVHSWIAELTFGESDAAVKIRDVTRMYALVRLVLSEAERRRDAVVMTEMCAVLGRYWFIRGALHEGVDWCRRALALDGPDTSARVWTMAFLGRLCTNKSDIAVSVEHLRQAQRLAAALGDRYAEMSALLYESSVAEWDGTLESGVDATAAAMRVLDYATESGDAALSAIAYNQLGISAYYSGHLEAARDFYVRALDASAGSDFVREIPTFHVNLGEVAADLGDIDLAVGQLRLAMETARALEYTTAHAVSLHLLLAHDEDEERRREYDAELRRLRSRIGPDLDERVAMAGRYDISNSGAGAIETPVVERSG